MGSHRPCRAIIESWKFVLSAAPDGESPVISMRTDAISSSLAVILPVAIAYFIGAYSGHSLFSLVGHSVSMAWPASGIALAAVLRYGKVAAAGIFLAIVAEELWIADAPVLWSCSIAISSTGAAVLAAWGMRREHFQSNMVKNQRRQSPAALGRPGIACRCRRRRCCGIVHGAYRTME